MTEPRKLSPEEAFLDYAQMLHRWTEMALGVRQRLLDAGVNERSADQAATQLLVMLIGSFAARVR